MNNVFKGLNLEEESDSFGWAVQRIPASETESPEKKENIKGFKSLFTHRFKSSFVLGQLLLTENAILCQKVDWKDNKKKK